MRAGAEMLERMSLLNLERIVIDAALDHEAEITDINRFQLDKGLDSDGRDLGSYAIFAYKNRFSPVDLKDTGAFRQSFDLKAFGPAFELIATDRKTNDLQERYGEAILGLSDEGKQQAGQIIAFDVRDELRRAIR